MYKTMRILILILLTLPNVVLYAQDSLSAVFTKILNEYRIQNNAYPLIYDLSLDSVSMVLLIESAHGIDDCFDNPERPYEALGFVPPAEYA